jgi:hypothetical protein
MYAKFNAHIRKALHGTMLLGIAFSAFGARNLPAARTLEAGFETRTETAAPTGSTTGTVTTNPVLESPDRCLTSMVRITIASEQISFCAPTSLPINIVEDSTSDPYVSYAGLDQINGYGIVNIKATTPGNTPGIGRPIYNLGGVVEYRQAVWDIESLKTDRIVSNGPTGVFWNETVPSVQIDTTLPISFGNLMIRSIEWYVEHHGRLWSFIMVWDTEAQNAQEWSEASKSFIVQAPDVTKLADTALDLGAVFLESKSTSGIPDLGVPIDVGEPPWWSGICDDNHYFPHTGIHSTLLSTWHGVSVCGPVPTTDHGVYFFPGAWGVLEFECVELVMRFLYLEWGIAPWRGNANKIKDSPPGSIVFYPNGTHAIVPGDIITEDLSIPNPFGHTALITNVSLDGHGTGTIRFLEQNASSAGHRRLSVINWQVQPDAYAWGQTIQGWLHVKTNSSLVTTISAGKRHTCWVKSDGAVACWGDNTYGQSTSPAGTFVQVSAGYAHTCGLKSDGTLACWGNNTYGRAAPLAGTFAQVSAGYIHTCGLKSDGTLACWGNNTSGRATPPDGTFIQVSAGYAHTCGLRSDGTLVCWGSNIYGQVTPPAGTFTQVSAGYAHNCGLKNDDTLACWGSNANGRATPPAGTFTQVSAGYKHTCGLKSDGTVACWGDNTYGQARPLAGTFVQVSAGYTHTCSLKSNGNVVCWGDNTDSQSAPFSISGNAGMGGTTLNYTDGSPKTVTAASDGSYSLVVSYNWSGMVTPSLTDYAFSPSSRSYTNVLVDQTDQNYTTLVTISGNVDVSGVRLSYVDVTPKTVTSTSDGNYSLTVPYGWSGTVMPSKTGYTFTPANRTYTNVLANQTGQNYTATAITYTISGNASVAGATLSYTGGSTIADGSGNYTITVSYNWSGTVTPSKTGYTFTPDHKEYSNVLANQTAQNYTATAITYTISGNASVGGATLSYTSGTPVTAGSDGNYTLIVPYGWSGTVTPSKTGYTFSPVNHSYTNVLANQTGQNYTSTAITYTISGNAGVGGATLSYIYGTAKTVTSTSNGSYTITVPYGWSGTVTPSKTKVTFTPGSRSYPTLTASQTAQDYAATATVKVTFNSVGAQDGWILESTETSGVGGTKDATATTFQLGDDELNRQYRAILSFNTASLPDNATIQSAVLKIKQSDSPVGSDPFTALGNLYATIRKGWFGSSSALQLTDFNATATATRVGAFNKTPVNGWYSATMNATGCNNINKTNLTQFRLFFSKDDNDNMSADFVNFVSGNASSGKPQLIITYTLP